MHFFVPGARNAAEAEKMFSSISALVEEAIGEKPASTRIRAIEFLEAGFRATAIVGSELEHEPVFCILETADSFLIYSPTRGLRRGRPISVAKQDVISVVRFAELAAV
jgi:hypothetical protein